MTLAAASYPPRIVQPLAAASDLGSLQRQLRWLFILLSTALLVAALLLTWNSYGQARAALQQKATAMAERQAALLAFLMNGVQAGLEAHLAPLPPSDTPLPGSPRRITAFAVDGTGQLSHPEVQDLLPPAEEWAVALRQTESRGQAIFTRPSLREGSYWSWGLLRPADSAALIAAPFRLDRLLQIWAAAEGYEEALLLVVGPDGRPWLVPPKVTTAMGKNAATSSEAPTILVALEDSEEAGLASGWDAPLVGVSPVGKHGLTVLVAFPPEVWRKGWLRDNSDLLIFGGLLLLGLLILVHSFYRRLAHTLSERDTALGALALSEARFRDFADAASDWFWESDRSHQLCWISRCSNAGDAARCSLLLGRSLERLGGEPASQAALQLYREALRDHRPFRDFVWRLCFNGEERWMKLSGKPVYDERQGFLGYRGSATDIEAQREAELHAQILQRRLAGAFEVARDATLLLDPQERLVLANESYKRSFFGACPELLQPGLAFRDLPRLLEEAGFPQQAALQREAQEALEELRRSGEPNKTLLLSDGRWMRINERSTPSGDVFCIFSEITEFKRREEELRHAKEEAELADRAKAEFLAVMSHELRTPLNAIIGFSDILRSELFGPLSPPRYRHYAEDINRSGRQLLDLINDILDASRAESGKLELQEEEVELEELLQRAVSMISSRADEAGLQVTCEALQEPLRLRGDRRKLLQMLLNLLHNAVKFTPRGGEVTLGAERMGSFLVLSVRDNGVGIAPEDLKRVLEPFTQLAPSLARQQEGSGLGLPLARRMAELHGGHIEIESQVGQGTKVSVFLPALRLVRPEESGSRSTA